jgi:hypothetical protein
MPTGQNPNLIAKLPAGNSFTKLHFLKNKSNNLPCNLPVTSVFSNQIGVNFMVAKFTGFIFITLALFFGACQREADPRDTRTDSIPQPPPPPPPTPPSVSNKKYYISQVNNLWSREVYRNFKYDSTNKLIEIESPYNLINHRFFTYGTDGLLKKVDFFYQPGWGAYNSGSDSLVYNSNKQVSFIYEVRNSGGYLEKAIDTVNYNSMGLISAMIDGGERLEFTYSKDSNLISFIWWRFFGTTDQYKNFWVSYGNYDTLPNPFHNLAGKYYFMKGLYDYTQHSPMPGEEYTQLSKNNPGYARQYDASGYLNTYSNLNYRFDSLGKLVLISNQQGNRNDIKYVLR